MGCLVESEFNNVGKSIILSDGRKLGYVVRGTTRENTILYFHGWPCSRLELLQTESFTSYDGVRIISVDRPGIGLSDFQKGRTVLTFVQDILELADYFGLEKFSIIGYSGGAPYAYACSYRIPERLNSVGIISGIGPYYILKHFSSWTERLTLSLGRAIPSLIRKQLDSLYAQPFESDDQEESKKQMLDRWMSSLPDADKEILNQSGVFDSVWTQIRETFTNGVEGATLDGILLLQNWGFKLSEIPAGVKITLWHGESDMNVPVGISQVVAREITHCTLHCYSEDGHFSLMLKNIDEIIKTLLCP